MTCTELLYRLAVSSRHYWLEVLTLLEMIK